jgi:molecular chaperone DnaK
MVSSTREQIDTALQDAGLTPYDLQKVILVGGTTRVPLVKRFITEKLGAAADTPNDHSPELMVVCGAAVQATKRRSSSLRTV